MNEEIQTKMTRYSEPKIIAILRQAEGGVPVAELLREHGMSIATVFFEKPNAASVKERLKNSPLLA